MYLKITQSTAFGKIQWDGRFLKNYELHLFTYNHDHTSLQFWVALLWFKQAASLYCTCKMHNKSSIEFCSKSIMYVCYTVTLWRKFPSTFSWTKVCPFNLQINGKDIIIKTGLSLLKQSDLTANIKIIKLNFPTSFKYFDTHYVRFIFYPAFEKYAKYLGVESRKQFTFVLFKY